MSLPSNSTRLERALDHAMSDAPEIPLRMLYNPATCPVELLPWLAWAWSVDRWDDTWPTAVKREVVASSFALHARKGTVGALRRVVEPIGYLLTVTEWWQLDPPGVPGTFAIEVGVNEGGMSETTYFEVERLLDDARPVSRHLVGLDIRFEPRLRAYTTVAVTDGDIMEIYP